MVVNIMTVIANFFPHTFPLYYKVRNFLNNFKYNEISDSMFISIYLVAAYALLLENV